jgi:hypothetical protein
VKGAAEELERLLSSLQPALDDERATATAQGRALAAADAALAAATAPPPRAPTPPPPPAPTGLSPGQAEELAAQRVAALCEALYLSRLFDITEEGRPTFGAQMERSAVLSWDSYTSAGNQARPATHPPRNLLLTRAPAQDPLTPADLEAIAQFGRVLTSRAPTSTLAHREALRRCTALAQTWAQRGSAPVPELGAVSMERLRDRCARVLSSAYCTQTPVMQTCTADTARQTAAAAAAAGAAGAALNAGPSSALFPPPPTVDPLFGGGPPLWVGTQFGDYDPRNL